MTAFGSTHRRGFLGRIAAAGAALTLPWDGASAGSAPQAAEDKWLSRLTGKHRCLFDSPVHADGFPQVHMHNFIETYRRAYNVPLSDVNAVGTFYGAGPTASLPLGFNDAMWARYKVGELLGLTDPRTGRPAERNMFYRPMPGDPVFVGGLFAVASIESLMQRGAIFLMCNNALNFWIGQLAQAGHGTAEAIGAELRANTLPGVEIVPAMVIAIQQAQAKGVAYKWQ